MCAVLPLVSVAQHQKITSSPPGQHTGFAGLQCSERNTRPYDLRRKGIGLAKAFACVLKRAVRTREVAGFGDPVEIDHDFVRWDYGLCERGPEGETPRQDRPRIRLGLNAKAGKFLTFVTTGLSILTKIGRHRSWGALGHGMRVGESRS
jgi:hypothetical protein